MSLDLALLACGVTAMIAGVYEHWRYLRRVRVGKWAAAALAKNRAHLEAQAALLAQHAETNPGDPNLAFLVEHLRTQIARYNKVDAAIAKRLNDA